MEETEAQDSYMHSRRRTELVDESTLGQTTKAVDEVDSHRLPHDLTLRVKEDRKSRVFHKVQEETDEAAHNII